MAQEDQSQRTSFASDSATDDKITATVSAGEIWYIDSLYVSSDGSAPDGTLGIEAAVEEPTILDSLDQALYDGLARSVRVNVQGDTVSGASGPIGAYAMAGESVRVGYASNGGAGGTLYATMIMRQVL